MVHLKMDRPPRHGGGVANRPGLSRQQVPILVATDRSGGSTMSYRLLVRSADNLKSTPVARALNIPHESINASMPHWPCHAHVLRIEP